MAFRLQGHASPLTGDRVINRIYEISRNFVKGHEDSGRFGIYHFPLEFEHLTGLLMVRSRLITGDSDFSEMDELISRFDSKQPLIKSYLDAGNSLVDCVGIMHGKNNCISTMIINQDTIKDLVSGQFLPSLRPTYCINSFSEDGNASLYQDFIEYRNKRLNDF